MYDAAVAELPFKFELPIDAWTEKAGEAGKERRIGGIISTESADRHGEIVLQRGLDFKDFLKNGWFNDNHSKDTTGILGYPIKVEKVQHAGKQAHRVEGYLLPGYKPADKIWDLARSLQKTGRRLGFSIEGSVRQRTGPRENVIAEAVVRNVAITNCFPGSVRVCGAGQKVTRRWYSGAMVTIRLAGGYELTGTPNHPVFTQRGWVALRDLDERLDRVGRFVGDFLAAPAVAHDVQHVPPMLEEVFDLARFAGARGWIGLAGESQFHGDVAHSQVDVVAVHRELRDRLKAAFAEMFGQDAFPAADKQAAFLARAGLGHDFVVGSALSAPGVVRSPGQFFALGGGSVPVAEQLFFPPGAGDAGPLGGMEHGLPADSVCGRDGGRALSSAIRFDKLAFKGVIDFRGHVFNLDSDHGWYGANGIIAHNCPVNTDTGLDVLAKSMVAIERGVPQDEVAKALQVLQRALAAGQAITAPATPSPGDGFAMRTESLERDPKRKRKLTKSEAIRFVMDRYNGLTEAQAARIVRWAAA